MGFLANLVKVKVSGTPGTGSITLGTVEAGFRSFADAGVPNNALVSYGIEDGTAREVGRGYFNSSTGVLTRGLVSSSTGSLLNLTANAVVFITPLTDDFDTGYSPVQGCIPSNTSGSETTSVTLSAGSCRDTTNQWTMAVSTAVSCPFNTTWSNTVSGGRDPAWTPANGQSAHLHRFMNPQTGAITHFWSQSATNPASPGTGYTVWRRLFSIVLESASTNIRAFDYVNGWVMLDVRSTDAVALADTQAAGTLRAISVPKGLTLNVLFWYTQATSSTSTYPVYVGIFSPDRPVPTFGVSTQYGHARLDNSSQRYFSGQVWQFCDTNAQVYTASTDTNGVIAFGVLGWEEPREMWF